ncbi:helix-turn-helix domain-containing protein [Ekhidna sp. To15]|uniref:helix-turn-helix domain-containing protein n=1 Tax=Ekhidna sp. To15 TaxID=3395267 RepID=UPI003F52094D
MSLALFLMTLDNLEGAFLYASILALIYLVAISFRRSKLNISEIGFRMIILALCVEVFVEWLFFTDLIRVYPHFMRMNTPFVMILPSSFYLCIESDLSSRQKFIRYDLIHPLIFVFFVIHLLPFYSLSAEEKIELYDVYLTGTRIDTLPVAAIYRAVQFLALFGIVWQLLRRSISNWGIKVKVISVTYILLWGMDLYRFFGPWSAYAPYDGYYLITFLLLVIYLELIGAFEKKNIKYHTSGIGKHKTDELAIRAKDLIETEKLFKNPKLTLADLATRLEVHHNYVSQAVNSHFGMSFKELINSLRVVEAKKLLLDEINDRLTFEAIAEMAGFNSISSFNAAFKRIVGETPSAFKKSKQ